MSQVKVDLGMLNTFLSKNETIDLRKLDLRHVSSIDNCEWTGFENEKDNLMKQLRVYQYLLWIVPNDRDDLAKKLLENGILSPAQITNKSKEEFIQNNIKLFDEDSVLAERVHIRATTLMTKFANFQQTRIQQSESPTGSPSTNTDLERLNAFLEKNQEIDFRTADLLHTTEQYQWAGFEGAKESLVNQLKAYQRMLRIIPQDKQDLAKKLLENGIHSALQITSIPKTIFIQDNLELFNNDPATAEQVYMRALALRKAVALQYVAYVQQVEPHTRTTSFIR